MLLQLDNISKSYKSGKKNRLVLKDLNLTIFRKDFIAIKGRSGSGKSTLLNILGAFDSFDSGNMIFNNVKIEKLSFAQKSTYRKKHIGFITQQYDLLSDRNVYENIVLPLKFLKIDKANQVKQVMHVMEMLGLEKYKKEYTSNLSGGEQQRVAIARAIVKNPDIILADEPTGALDDQNEANILKILQELNNIGKTIIVVTHDDVVAKRSNQIYYLQDGKLHT